MAFQPLNAPPRQAAPVAAPPQPPPPQPHPQKATVLALVDQAFGAKPELQDAVRHALGKDGGVPPQQFDLFESISRYIIDLQSAASYADNERESKRRKVDAPQASTGATNGHATTTITVARTAPATGSGDSKAHLASWSGQAYEGISFTTPQRKKMTLEISPSPQQGIRALNAEGQAEFGIPYTSLDHIFRLPLPEKAQSTHNFCAFPRNALTQALSSDASAAEFEPMVWSAPDTLPRGADASTATPSAAIISTLQKTGASVVEPDQDEFASALEQAHRKGETAFHVRGFRGSKEGYLFFLGPGVVWGFKKPLLFFPFGAIESVSYTAVLQRTFNLVVVAMVGSDGAGGERTEEIEFQMLDQADFAGIDAYIKRHGLNDASMADARKAKLLNINGPRRGQGAAEGEGGGTGGGELQKAHEEAEALRAQGGGEDDEDDEEDDENFDPGSEGESEGSGSSDDDGEGGEGGGDDDDGDDDDDDDGDED